MYLTFKGVHQVNNTYKFITAWTPQLPNFGKKQKQKPSHVHCQEQWYQAQVCSQNLVLSFIKSHGRNWVEAEWTDINVTRMPFCITYGLKNQLGEISEKMILTGAFVISRESGGLIDQCVIS